MGRAVRSTANPFKEDSGLIRIKWTQTNSRSAECVGLSLWLFIDLIWSCKHLGNSYVHLTHLTHLRACFLIHDITWGIGVPSLYHFTIFLFGFGWLEFKSLHQSICSWLSSSALEIYITSFLCKCRNAFTFSLVPCCPFPVPAFGPMLMVTGCLSLPPISWHLVSLGWK